MLSARSLLSLVNKQHFKYTFLAFITYLAQDFAIDTCTHCVPFFFFGIGKNSGSLCLENPKNSKTRRVAIQLWRIRVISASFRIVLMIIGSVKWYH